MPRIDQENKTHVKLPPRTQELLLTMAHLEKEMGIPPSLGEIAAAFGRTIRAVRSHLDILIERGYVAKIGKAGTSRSLKVLRLHKPINPTPQKATGVSR